jgi:hypothetical protein
MYLYSSYKEVTHGTSMISRHECTRVGMIIENINNELVDG